MGRPYSAAELRDTVLRAAERVEGLCLGFDVIAGFPGEDEKDFGETLGLLEALPFAYLHVFPFSARRGTPAWGMAHRVPEAAVKERAAALRALSRRKRQAFFERQLGTVLAALPEGESAEGRLKLTTRNYIPVRVPWSGPVPTGEVRVVLNRLSGDEVLGQVSTEQTRM
jgi:threonylcarbamoyladenosine tRNA methylthiotransferase MtaB